MQVFVCYLWSWPEYVTLNATSDRILEHSTIATREFDCFPPTLEHPPHPPSPSSSSQLLSSSHQSASAKHSGIPAETMGKRTRRLRLDRPSLPREWSRHSDGPVREVMEEVEFRVKGASQRLGGGQAAAGEKAAPARRQPQGQGSSGGATSAVSDRSAARPDLDNPNLIALGARNKLNRRNYDDDDRPAKSQWQETSRVQLSAGEPVWEEDADEDARPTKLLCLRPYGQLTPLSDGDDTSAARMAPAPAPLAAPNGQPGPHPSFIEVAKPYIFQQKVEQYLAAIAMPEAKEDSIRLQGVQLIDNVRKSLQL